MNLCGIFGAVNERLRHTGALYSVELVCAGGWSCGKLRNRKGDGFSGQPLKCLRDALLRVREKEPERKWRGVLRMLRVRRQEKAERNQVSTAFCKLGGRGEESLAFHTVHTSGTCKLPSRPIRLFNPEEDIITSAVPEKDRVLPCFFFVGHQRPIWSL